MALRHHGGEQEKAESKDVLVMSVPDDRRDREQHHAHLRWEIRAHRSHLRDQKPDSDENGEDRHESQWSQQEPEGRTRRRRRRQEKGLTDGIRRRQEKREEGQRDEGPIRLVDVRVRTVGDEV